MPQLLIADDEAHIREVLRVALERAGHSVREAQDGDAALQLARNEHFDLIVLDIVMPGTDGLEVCRALRAEQRTPIIFLTSRDDEIDRILGLELGADDYLSKPFSPRELVARVKAVLRRMAPAQAPPPGQKTVIEHGPLTLDSERHRCTVGEEEVVLTVTEFALLRCLLRSPGRVYTRDQLVERAYGDGHVISDRTIDSHVRRIRKKLLAAGVEPVETVYGLGYRAREVL